MVQTYYTYHIRITQRSCVHVEKRDPSNNDVGQPTGSFGYKGKSKTRIQALHQAARQNTLASDEVRELGELLFAILFDAALRQDFFHFYEQVRQEPDALLRLELDIDERLLPEIAALPWEFLRVPNSTYGTFWIGTTPDLIFSRRRAHWSPPLPIRLTIGERLRIALVVATPTELGAVKYEKIWQDLQHLAHTQPDQFELLDIVTSASKSKIDAVLKQRPHIFHFIGHGRLKDEYQREIGQIALVDDGLPTKALWMDAESFSELFSQHRPGIVLLQACEGGALSASHALVGVASQIIQHNIPVVIAMQYEVSNATAQHFMQKFYNCLSQHHPVDKAAQEGRRAISLGPASYNTRDFATPVFFMRIADGHLLPIDLEQPKITLENHQQHMPSPQDARPHRVVTKAKNKGIAIHTMHGNVYQHNDGQSNDT